MSFYTGSVKGGQILGKYPENLWNTSPYIFDGISIPTTPLDSVWNSVSEWMGVTTDDGLDLAVPNRNAFPAESIWAENVLFG